MCAELANPLNLPYTRTDNLLHGGYMSNATMDATMQKVAGAGRWVAYWAARRRYYGIRHGSGRSRTPACPTPSCASGRCAACRLALVARAWCRCSPEPCAASSPAPVPSRSMPVLSGHTSLVMPVRSLNTKHTSRLACWHPLLPGARF